MQGILRHTDYAVRIVLHVAALDPTRATVTEIAGRRLMPAPFVRRVVARLAAAGILRTFRGSGGGVAIARPPAAVSLLDVVRAMEGGIVLNRCVSEPEACPLSGDCPVHRAWRDAARSAEESLEKVTFADLLKPPKRSPRSRKER